MKKYTLVVTTRARRDITDVYNHIHDVYKQSLTANRYLTGIINKINRLPIYGAPIAPSQNAWLQFHFGTTIRHIRYKRMTILFTVHGHCIFIKRVIAAKFIR
jgi:plasmid stabilization system protein ParE